MRGFIKDRVRVRPGTIIAALALFIVIGGTATAASGLINGKKIKPGTVTAKQIKNKTITTGKLAPAAVRSLRGETGPAGVPGAPGTPGSTGATGPAGADGIVAPITFDGATVNLPGADTYYDVLNAEVPPGSYMVSARVSVLSQAPSNNNRIGCAIAVDDVENFDLADTVYQSPLSQNDEINLSLMAVTEAEEALTVICTTETATAQVSRTRLIAVPVQG